MFRAEQIEMIDKICVGPTTPDLTLILDLPLICRAAPHDGARQRQGRDRVARAQLS